MTSTIFDEVDLTYAGTPLPGLLDRVGSPTVAIVGLGYVGLPIALEFAKQLKVIGFDINAGRVAQMKQGIDPSGELVKADFDGCDITFTDSLEVLRQAADSVYVDAKVKEYMIDVIRATRKPADYGLEMTGLIQLGASTRAAIALLRASKAHAFLSGRGYVTPEDVKAAAPDVLRHRLVISFEAEAEDLRPEALVKQILDRLPVP